MPIYLIKESLNLVGSAMILKELSLWAVHRFTALRELRGYTTVDSRTVQTKHSKTCTSSKRHEQGMNCNFKYWNELEKMSRIYADWIEEIPPVHSKVECWSSVRMRHG